jgi:hypothetical protein
MLGPVQATPTGATTELSRTRAAGGPVVPLGSYTNTMSPGEAGGQVQWTDSTGTVQHGTGAQYATERGMGRVVGPAQPVAGGAFIPPAGAPTTAAPAGNPLIQSNRLAPIATGAPYTAGNNAAAEKRGQALRDAVPKDATQPTADQTAAVVAATRRPAVATAPGGLTSTPGPSPGTVEAAGVTARDSATQGQALVSRADLAPVNKANYANMLSDLSKLDTMGPGTERETFINGMLQKFTGGSLSMDKSQIAGAESFAKIANMIAAQQLGSLGPTDARQSLAMGANPHLDLSKLGNTQIIHMLQGNEDAINAKAKAWQQWIAPTSKGGQEIGRAHV